MYTWESSLAEITYLPFAAKQAEIWLLVFRKPETEENKVNSHHTGKWKQLSRKFSIIASRGGKCTLDPSTSRYNCVIMLSEQEDLSPQQSGE
jgi:hypothetical protein